MGHLVFFVIAVLVWAIAFLSIQDDIMGTHGPGCSSDLVDSNVSPKDQHRASSTFIVQLSQNKSTVLSGLLYACFKATLYYSMLCCVVTGVLRNMNTHF